jgi:predicted PurR-regulated permease PerM
MKQLFGETHLRILAVAGFLVVLVLAFFAIQILLVPFVAALFVFYLYDPAVILLQRRGMDRGPAFMLLLGATVITIGAMLVLMPAWLQLESIGASNQTFTDRFSSQLNALELWVNSKVPMAATIHITSEVTAKSAALATHFLAQLPGLITSFTVNLLLVPFIAYFMIRDGKTLKRRIVEVVPNRYFEMSLIMFTRIDQQIGGYFRGRLIECLLVATTQALFMGVATVFVPQQNVLLIAGVCGATSMIPYLGPVLGTTFGVFLYIGSGLPMTSVYGLIAAAVGAHVIDNILIAPAVLSHNVDMHPLIVALVLVIGGELFGALGLLIAIPVASTIKVVVQEFYANYQLQVRT